ncbi:MAG: flagellar basal-body rod protein FlgF [Bdellovibrionaceae bacterium]|nr:flagellar basal-body rod protein FlgF [Bdellovibrionales bacterium]MCB9084886.1 flagellar basal-body rod protein FlgF [Pseudobdellovibrionaceae bacterium]
MSSKGIYTALSGAMAQSSKLETLANNIANSNTTSFKKDRQVFNEYLSAYEKLPEVIQVPKIPASIESFYDMQGGDRGYVNAAGSYTDFAQGALKPSGNVLDFGLEGKGFFEVLTPQGVRLTRNGSFTVDTNGRMVTKEGYPVLAQGAQDPAQRTIQIGNNRNITVSYEGEVFVGGESVADLSLVEPRQADGLIKTGSSLYGFKPTFNTELRPSDGMKVHQGFLEGSNVNIVEEMTDMIATTRAFESTQQAIKAFDQMDQKLMTEVPRTS